MNIESIFNKYYFDYDKLREYGFSNSNGKYTYNKLFHDDEFRVEIEISNSIVISKVIEVAFDEEYTNIFVKDVVGDFVNSIKYEYIEILKDIRDKCCNKKYFIYDQSNRIASKVEELYKVRPEFLWEDDDTSGVFRHNDTKKWFGIIMCIDKSKIVSNSKGNVEVLNIKSDNVEELLDKKGFYPAYHMNKKNWISIILDDNLSDEDIIDLISKSYNMTKEIRTWIIPANPKIFDVEDYIKGKNVIDWPVKRGIIINDKVYIYYAKPYGALLFKGIVVDIDKEWMKIEILERYNKEDYPLEVLKKYGLNSVRSTRRIGEELYNYLEM